MVIAFVFVLFFLATAQAGKIVMGEWFFQVFVSLPFSLLKYYGRPVTRLFF